MLNIHQKFCRETFYDGKLVDFKPVYQDNFNFAYDVIDVIAQAEPERRAMLWCNDKKLVEFRAKIFMAIVKNSVEVIEH